MSHVDYLSWSFPVEGDRGENDLDMKRAVLKALGDMFEDDVNEVLAVTVDLKKGTTHRPFSAALHCKNTHMTVQWNHKLSHAVVEFAGKGCAVLAQLGILYHVIDTVQSSIVRLDIATDYMTEVTPTQFTGEMSQTKFRSYAVMSSSTGETVYIGSRTSERFARVYRYNEPHPRAKLLRVEYHLKKQYARAAAADMLSQGVDQVARALGDVFGWAHPVIEDEVEAAELSTVNRNTSKHGTVIWLYDAVLPALKKLREENPEELQTWITTMLAAIYSNCEGM